MKTHLTHSFPKHPFSTTWKPRCLCFNLNNSVKNIFCNSDNLSWNLWKTQFSQRKTYLLFVWLKHDLFIRILQNICKTNTQKRTQYPFDQSSSKFERQYCSCCIRKILLNIVLNLHWILRQKKSNYSRNIRQKYIPQ